MIIPVKFKQLTLLFGDIIILYLSLALTLFLRYGEITNDVRTDHFTPFTILFFLWLLVFYILGFYEWRNLKNDQGFGKNFGAALLVNFMIAIVLFYFVPGIGIAPKTNLFLFFAIMSGIAYVWRTTYNNLLFARSPAKRILVVGYNRIIDETIRHINENPQLGYDVTFWMKDGLRDKEFRHLSQIILAHQINLILVPAHVKKNSVAARKIYKSLVHGIEVMDIAELYETLFGKVPLAELKEVWFIENLAKSHRVYDAVKRPLELALAAIIGFLFLPFLAFITILIKLTSPGSAFFTQRRIGKHGAHFTLWKFRTMIENAEARGPKWATKNDRRITPIGRILRRTHLDELPQIWNVFRGELSLVGPRPERPEFTVTLEKEIPYYDLRHLVTPGLTGWAQVNYRYGASLDDSYEKLQYDIYYLKHRSIFLDLIVLIRTLKLIFIEAH